MSKSVKIIKSQNKQFPLGGKDTGVCFLTVYPLCHHKMFPARRELRAEVKNVFGPLLVTNRNNAIVTLWGRTNIAVISRHIATETMLSKAGVTMPRVRLAPMQKPAVLKEEE